MFKKIFQTKKKENNKVLIAALLIHAAKVDDKYTDSEKEIIKRALINLDLSKQNDSEKLLEIA